MAARVVLAPWPAALGGAIFLLIGRWLACDRDPYQFGNAWAALYERSVPLREHTK